MRSDRDALRGSLGFYRAFDTTLAQNDKRASQKLAMPVLAIGGAASYGDHVAHAMEPLADNVQVSSFSARDIGSPSRLPMRC